MKKLIFIINGSGGTGKDSFCNIIKQYSGHDTYTISSANRAKKIAMDVFGWDGISKNEKSRKLLATIKDLLTWWDDIPFKDMKGEIMYFEATPSMEIMFIHVREPQEIQKLVDIFPHIKTILITNKNVPNITSNDADAGVFNYKYDYYIENNGTLDDLKDTALSFINQFYKENN